MSGYVYAKDSTGRIYRFDNHKRYEYFLVNRSYPYDAAIETITRSHFSGIKKILEYDNPYWDEISLGVCVYRNRWY